MSEDERDDLMRRALGARKKAVAPYSKFKVGAALVTESGEFYTGANVESASYGLTCCAERVALFNALTDGARRFRAIAIAAPHKDGATPCGACRQLLAEYAPKAVLFTADSRRPRRIREFSIKELLPEAFRL